MQTNITGLTIAILFIMYVIRMLAVSLFIKLTASITMFAPLVQDVDILNVIWSVMVLDTIRIIYSIEIKLKD
jgi:hypothetical protein